MSMTGHDTADEFGRGCQIMIQLMRSGEDDR